MKSSSKYHKVVKYIGVAMVVLAATIMLPFGIVSAAEYRGDVVVPGLDGIQPGDVLYLPENTYEASLTATWGLRIKFIDYDQSELSNELVNLGDEAPIAHAPENPTRPGYKFVGWERYDTNEGTVTLNEDGSITDIAGPGPIIYIANYEEDFYKVTYDFVMDETWGAPDDSIVPIDSNLYKYNDTVKVLKNSTQFKGYATNRQTGEKVYGIWTLTIPDDADFQITQDTTINGSWSFEPTYEDINVPGTGNRIAMYLGIGLAVLVGLIALEIVVLRKKLHN